MQRKIRILLSSLFQDAGEATRGLEIAKGLKDNCPAGFEADIRFLSHGGRFEKLIADNGFRVEHVTPKMSDANFWGEMKTKDFQFIGDEKLAYAIAHGEAKVLKAFTPDVLIHGFWPTAGIAAKFTHVPVEIAYMPLPFAPGPFSIFLMKDLPDFVPFFTRFHVSVRKKIMSAIPKGIKLKSPWIKQECLCKAAAKLGAGEINNLFDMLKSDFTVVNDLPVFYEGNDIPENFEVTGPLFAQPADSLSVPPEITQLFNSEPEKIKIFCTLGSSGKRRNLIEAVTALRMLSKDKYCAAVLCPPSVCPLQKARDIAFRCENIFITDTFVPAATVNSMADVVICHGGQGTVQTAVYSGTPLVGFAVQPEQQVNLEHIEEHGAGIRIPLKQWEADNIAEAVETVAHDSSYRENMGKLQDILLHTDGKKGSAEAIWKFIGTKIK